MSFDEYYSLNSNEFGERRRTLANFDETISIVRYHTGSGAQNWVSRPACVLPNWTIINGRLLSAIIQFIKSA